MCVSLFFSRSIARNRERGPISHASRDRPAPDPPTVIP
jgi:hypothetical protein